MLYPLLRCIRTLLQTLISSLTGKRFSILFVVISFSITGFVRFLFSLAQGFESLSEFARHLAATVDIVFPVIHGRFGEDGGIQELLENFNIPFVGTQSRECRKAFDKYDASLELERQGFVTAPSVLVQGSEMDEAELSKWFARYQLDTEQGKVVICR